MVSAGILLYRRRAEVVEVLLAHPGGPIWANRDDGAWSLPKGEADDAGDYLEVARREFEEEIGVPPRCDEPQPLGSVTQKSGKVVFGWACEGDVDPTRQRSNTFSMEWPPRSGRIQEFPEVDQGRMVSSRNRPPQIEPGASGVRGPVVGASRRVVKTSRVWDNWVTCSVAWRSGGFV